MQAAARLVNRPSPPVPVAVARAAAPMVGQATPMRPQCQSLRVSSPGDAAEVEARQVARQIVSMPASLPAARPGTLRSPPALARSANSAPAANRAARAAPPTAASGGGEALPPALRQDMESRFRADFSRIRIHRDARAASASRALNAQAFTVGHQVFFGAGAWQPGSASGRELIAHELTHTIQQGAATQIRRSTEAPTVLATGPQAVQRLGIGDALDFFARGAEAIPGFRMFTLVLGRNPINLQAVDRSPGNLLRAVVELMPGGVLITRALDGYGIIDRVAGWVQQQIDSLGLVAGSIRQAIDRFLDSLSWTGIFDLGGVWERARRIVSEPIQRITAFIGSLVAGVLRFIRDAVLRPLAGLAQGARGWDLLCAVLGRNPITGEAVPRSAAALIGGFMRLIGQEEIWQNLQRARAVDRAFAWFQGALGGLLGFVTALPGLFMATLGSLGIADLLTPVQTFQRIVGVFGDFAGRFFGWAGQQVMSLLEIIFDVVAPAVMPYIRRAAAAFRTIVADPVRFVRNLVRAAMQGFRQFATNIVAHLRAAIIGWLTGSLAGANVHIPQAFTLPEIVRFVLSVLGLTWQNVRTKLVRAVGETAVAAMETGFDIVVTLVRDGPAAAWERIRESLANLREMVMEQVLNFVRDNIVTAAVTRLLSMLSPAGAFIQAIIATYNTIMFFVERLRQIAQVAAAFIDSMAAIASGVITAAANRVEQTMAGLLTLVISFLARLIGLGRVSDAITTIINRIRAPIDRALDRVVEWIVRMGRRFMGAVRGAAGRVTQWWRRRQGFRAADGHNHSLYFAGEGPAARLTVASDPMPVEDFLAGIAGRSEYQTPEKRALISQVRQQVTAIRAAQVLPEAQAAQAETQIAAAFSAMTPLLTQLLEGPAFATEAQPLPMRYPKRRWSAYPTIYVGPLSENRITQDDLRNNRKADIRAVLSASERAAWLTQGEPIRALRPTESNTLGGNALGVQAGYRTEPGKKWKLVPGATEGGGLINGVLRPYGYRARSEAMDGDHVIEMQIGGPNSLPNLWPLAAGENRASGSIIANMNFTKPDGSTISMDALKARARSGIDVWVVITATL
jgi:phage-related protein